MELAEAAERAAEAAGEEEVEQDDGDGEDDADEAFGEDVEGAGGGEEEAGRVVGPSVETAPERGCGTRSCPASVGSRLQVCSTALRAPVEMNRVSVWSGVGSSVSQKA